MDVLADLLQLRLAADDVFIVVALPEGLAGGVLHSVDAPCRKRFKRPDDFGQAAALVGA